MHVMYVSMIIFLQMQIVRFFNQMVLGHIGPAPFLNFYFSKVYFNLSENHDFFVRSECKVACLFWGGGVQEQHFDFLLSKYQLWTEDT